jgi:capsular polysaccharide biosynthesis protein
MTTITNPTVRVPFSGPISASANHVSEVAQCFPNEYRIVEQDERRMVVLHTPLVPDTIGKDILLTAELSSDIMVTASNETGMITSYGEQKRDQDALDVFAKLVRMSMEGTLRGVVDKQNKQAKSTAEQTSALNIILAIVGLAIAVYAAVTFIRM